MIGAVFTTLALVCGAGCVVTAAADNATERLDLILAEGLERTLTLFQEAKSSVSASVSRSHLLSSSQGNSIYLGVLSYFVAEALRSNRTVDNPLGSSPGYPYLNGRVASYSFGVGYLRTAGEQDPGELRRECAAPAERAVTLAVRELRQLCSDGCGSSVSAVEFERRIKTSLDCLLRFSSEVSSALELEFAVEEVAATLVLGQASRMRRRDGRQRGL